MFKGLFRRSAPASAKPSDPWSLSTPLFRLSKQDVITIGNAVEGILVTGASGSGKSSGSGKYIALSFLRAGFGGIVLCAKPDERATWERYCREAGRSDDLIIFSPSQPWRYNFIDHELNRAGEGAGLTENILNLFSTVTEMIERGSGQGGGGRQDEAYWRRSNRQLCRNLIDLLVFAKGTISIPELYRLAVSAPTSMDQVRSEEWKKRSFCFHCLAEADKRPKTPRQTNDFGIVADYFLLEFPGLSEKTRSVVMSTFTSMIDVLNRGVLRELFCEGTNLTPDVIPQGKIIVVDLSVKEYGEVGLCANVLMKYTFMRSIERRDVGANSRPVFLWQDEGQLFSTNFDMPFQTTARASRVATVVMTQSINNFYALGEGQQGKAQADSIFGNLNLKIWHANADPVTNEWASTQVGRCKQYMVNTNSSHQPADWMSVAMGTSTSQMSAGVSEQYEYALQPSAFSRLRTGGLANQREVDAIVFCSGLCFQATGKNWMRVTFSQR
jgi:hypothetical protein